MPKRSSPDLVLTPYYTSLRATLVHPDGHHTQLGELPKFIHRVLLWDWKGYIAECRKAGAKSIDDSQIMARVLVRDIRKAAGFQRNRQVYALLKQGNPWDWWA